MLLKKCQCKDCKCQKYTMKDTCQCNKETKSAHYKFLKIRDETREFQRR